MRGEELTKRQTNRIGNYMISVQSLDAHCATLRVMVQKQELKFEETLHIHDFVDIKKQLKNGKKLEEINQMSLLFLKLMVSSISEEKVIVELDELPFKKILRDSEKIKTASSKIVQEVRGLMLVLSKEIAVLIPKTLVETPSSNNQKTVLTKTEEKKEANEKRIKEIFEFKG